MSILKTADQITRNEMQLRLGFTKQMQQMIGMEINRCQTFCMHCEEDKIYCQSCIIPSIKGRLKRVFNE